MVETLIVAVAGYVCAIAFVFYMRAANREQLGYIFCSSLLNNVIYLLSTVFALRFMWQCLDEGRIDQFTIIAVAYCLAMSLGNITALVVIKRIRRSRDY